MFTSLFDYHLPECLIAQHSVQPRDHSRLMVLDRLTGARQHKKFFEIVEELRAGDVLVFNDTKVFRARLLGSRVTKDKAGQQKTQADETTNKNELEVFLLRPLEGTVWEVLMKPGRRIRVGDSIAHVVSSDPTQQTLYACVREKRDDGVLLIEYDQSPSDVFAFANAHGEIPIPPYVKTQPESLEQYQTIYARETGSVAAPTAGFHFTSRVMDALKTKGVQFEFVTLHVGIGTFRPMKSETLEEHKMHSEFVSLDANTAERINQAKKEGRRVIAVGTTTVRTLEGIAQLSPLPSSSFDSLPPTNYPLLTLPLRPFTHNINLFIKPGFDFKVIDGLITNFHLPKSTLLVLVSAFAGRESVLFAYEEAIKKEYRFFSFGDAMFIR